ncbi:MAG: glycosyltransferase family 2 protein [Candidatus Bathyarchaeota archaeon]|nr:glycosyltransferase family 2 protein [Candidatus Bathyarchaeota archaeon]
MIKAPKVAIIIVNYNGLKYLNNCLSSLQEQTYPNYSIIVYDNASTDNSVNFIKKNFPNVLVIEGSKNVGFAQGNNLAIAYAQKQNPAYLFLVNNDTAADRDLLQKIVDTIQSDESLGIVAPAVYDLYNRETLQELGMTIDRFGYPLALKKPEDKNKVFFVSGCAMLIKSDVIRKIGAFDDNYFMFAEDLDLSWRAQLAGYLLTVNGSAKIFHASGGSLEGGVLKASKYSTNNQRIFFRERNTLRTLLKNYDLANVFGILPFYCGALLFESALWFSYKKPQTAVALLRAVSYNVRFFPDAYRDRLRVQQLRKTSDRVLGKKMVRGYCKLVIMKSVGVPNVR